ncbi:hypothetical protein IJM86_00135 [bacterium]|nr:hypothetical protein [bacterium]
MEKIGFTEDTFRQKKEISRYDLARILNIIDCQDCFIPDDWTKQYYNFNYWNDFIQNPDNNFNDIKYL